jgi:hypothetical protein
MLRARVPFGTVRGFLFCGSRAIRPLSSKATEKVDSPQLDGLLFKDVRVGIVKEVSDGEKRVAGTPESVANLVKKGFKVTVQEGAGVAGYRYC